MACTDPSANKLAGGKEQVKSVPIHIHINTHMHTHTHMNAAWNLKSSKKGSSYSFHYAFKPLQSHKAYFTLINFKWNLQFSHSSFERVFQKATCLRKVHACVFSGPRGTEFLEQHGQHNPVSTALVVQATAREMDEVTSEIRRLEGACILIS